mgnify:CR=1 FL=1
MTEAELKGLAVAQEVNCEGEACPGPVLKAMEALGAIEAGQVAVLVTDVKAAVENVSVAVETGGLAKVLGVVEEDGLFRLYMERL